MSHHAVYAGFFLDTILNKKFLTWLMFCFSYYRGNKSYQLIQANFNIMYNLCRRSATPARKVAYCIGNTSLMYRVAPPDKPSDFSSSHAPQESAPQANGREAMGHGNVLYNIRTPVSLYELVGDQPSNARDQSSDFSSSRAPQADGREAMGHVVGDQSSNSGSS